LCTPPNYTNSILPPQPHPATPTKPSQTHGGDPIIPFSGAFENQWFDLQEDAEAQKKFAEEHVRSSAARGFGGGGYGGWGLCPSSGVRRGRRSGFLFVAGDAPSTAS